MTDRTWDVAVIGAGVFGAWTAWHLQQAGQRVLLCDAYGAANSRASSGGESRIIRMGYGPDDIYTRWSRRALTLWQDFAQRTGQPLFQRTGVLWIARQDDPYSVHTEATLQRLGIPYEALPDEVLAQRYPHMRCEPGMWALFEPDSGVLMARRAVQAVVQDFVDHGGDYQVARLTAPSGQGHIAALCSSDGTSLPAGQFVFACGPWLPTLFPALLAECIYPTRQEVYFFGIPAGESRFAPPHMPAWIDFGNEMYGLPDLEQRGFKVALDRHGELFDPDNGERLVSPDTLTAVRQYLARRFPVLAQAPLVEARVCQYENTSNGDFLIDRHPHFDNVWLLGGGSGHGFKHGPALGEYVTARLLHGQPGEPRFTLATKARQQQRTVF